MTTPITIPRLTLLLLVLGLTACSGATGPKVFPDAESALTELADIRFGERCTDIHTQVREHLSERERSPGSNFMMNVSYPTLGSSIAYFDCSDEDDRLERVRIMLSAPLRDYAPYERALERLRARWGEPASEHSRRDAGPNASRIRALGGTPEEYELKRATWRHGANITATLEMTFTFVEIQLFLRYEQG